ncbi:MAG: enoyl-CoA hydratase-related protein [bacterium]
MENGVLNIILNRPGKSNGLSIGMYVNITNAINNAQKNEKVKIIVLSGLGKNFCSGNDL